ncbi:YggT family protein [Schaalia cardiffensis]|nr:YggT family protein [Schaalia cardiffensis]
MVFDWLQLLVPSFSPRGVLALFANLIYAASDPPIRWLRARIPPLHLGGGFALDVGFILLFIALMMLQRFSLLLMSFG